MSGSRMLHHGRSRSKRSESDGSASTQQSDNHQSGDDSVFHQVERDTDANSYDVI